MPVDTGRCALILLAGIESLVNKKDIVGKIALDAQITRAQATLALEACLSGIRTGLERGDRVTLSGLAPLGCRNAKPGGCEIRAAEGPLRFGPNAFRGSRR